MKKTENIELVLDTVIEEIKGEGQVQSIDISNKKTKEKRSLPVDGVFIAVGTMPNTESFSGLVKMDDAGYIIAGEDTKTSRPGIFAAGDLRTKPLRQVITAAADGANAITAVEEYLHGL